VAAKLGFGSYWGPTATDHTGGQGEGGEQRCSRGRAEEGGLPTKDEEGRQKMAGRRGWTVAPEEDWR
jgi:hypothetical protein